MGADESRWLARVVRQVPGVVRALAASAVFFSLFFPLVSFVSVIPQPPFPRLRNLWLLSYAIHLPVHIHRPYSRKHRWLPPGAPSFVPSVENWPFQLCGAQSGGFALFGLVLWGWGGGLGRRCNSRRVCRGEADLLAPCPVD